MHTRHLYEFALHFVAASPQNQMFAYYYYRPSAHSASLVFIIIIIIIIGQIIKRRNIAEVITSALKQETKTVYR